MARITPARSGRSVTIPLVRLKRDRALACRDAFYETAVPGEFVRHLGWAFRWAMAHAGIVAGLPTLRVLPDREGKLVGCHAFIRPNTSRPRGWVARIRFDYAT